MKRLWDWREQKIGWQVEGNLNNAPFATILIHGFGACKEHWRFNQRVLGDLAPCYSIDLVGFGESSQPISNLPYEIKKPGGFEYSFDNWSQQIVDFCTEVVQKPVILIGNSIGGVIALNASKKISEQCITLILIDCAQRTMDDKKLLEQSILMRFLRPIIKTCVRQRLLSTTIFKNAAKPAFIESILKIAYPTGSNVDKELINILLKPAKRDTASEAFRGFINIFNDHLAPDLLKNIDIPVHLIWGEKDPWEPVQVASEWNNKFDCIKSFNLISRAGHCPHDESPEKVNPILLKIIQEAI